MRFLKKSVLRKILRKIPLYYRTKKNALNCVDSVHLVRQKLQENIDNVPFYSSYDFQLNHENPLHNIPVLRKCDVIANTDMLRSRSVSKCCLHRVETGGSTGVSLSLYRSVRDVIKEIAFVDALFSLVGKNLIVGVLRGNKPKSGLFEVVSKHEVLLSSYSLSLENIDAYLDILQSYNVSCLHVYPSSLVILARLIKQKYGKVNLPKLKGIFASSEIFSREDKEFVKSVFSDVKIIDFYGHNEQACCAYSIDDGEYHFLPMYGYVEFLDTGEKVNGHRIAEIVATSIMNEAMPLVRYATEDYVELDECGRVLSIIGRSSDFVLNKNGDVVPCIFSTRPLTLKNVLNFQYFQEKQGELHFRVVVTDEFSEKDIAMIKEDLQTSFDGKMVCFVDVVPQIERTKRGKQMRLIQKLTF